MFGRKRCDRCERFSLRPNRIFKGGSEFEVQVHPGPEPGLFELTDYTGEPVRKVTLELDLRT